MSKFLVAASAVLLLACGTEPAPVPLDTLLPTAADLPPGAEIQDLDGDEQLVLSLKLDAPSDGLGLPDERTFDPPECKQRNDDADAARLGLIEDGVGRAVRVGGERTYVLLISESAVDLAAVSDVCAEYRTSWATVRTDKLDIPEGLESNSAVVLSEVTDPLDPERTGDANLLGYAVVNGYTAMVLGYQGADFRDEFDAILTSAVAKVAAGS